MSRKTSHLYRVALLLSITLAIVLLGLTVERDVLSIAFIVLGCIAGTFVLDLDYVIHAFFVDPQAPFSKSVADYVRYKDIRGLLSFIYIHKNDVEDKTLNSALFQIVLGGLSLFVVSSTFNPFIKALVISTFTNSIYRFGSEYMQNRTDQWFWSLKVNTSKGNLLVYTLILLGILFYSLFLF